MLLVLLVSGGGCASKSGWAFSASRTCAPKTAPRVCVLAEPDHGHVIRVGDVELLPGECVVAPDDARAGLIRVYTRSRAAEQRRHWLATHAGKVTLISVDADGKLDAEQRRCDQTPFAL